MRTTSLVLLLLGACTSPMMYELDDQGRLCVAADPYSVTTAGATTQTFSPDRPLFAQVSATAGCVLEVESSCSIVERNPHVFEVHAHLAWNEGGACTREVHTVSVDCSAPVGRGNVTFVYAGETIDVPVPGTMQAVPCIGDQSDR